MNIFSDNNFKSSKYKVKLLGNTAAQPASNVGNGILKNATTAIPLKYLSNLWGSLAVPLINCKAELKMVKAFVCRWYW